MVKSLKNCCTGIALDVGEDDIILNKDKMTMADDGIKDDKDIYSVWNVYKIVVTSIFDTGSSEADKNAFRIYVNDFILNKCSIWFVI